MPLNLDAAICYDEETLPNIFSFLAIDLLSDREYYFEIGDQGRDDRRELRAWLNHWHTSETPMIGFNNVGFDYPVLHEFWQNPDLSAYDLYLKAQEIIRGGDRFGNMVWQSDRLAPQIDLYLVHHFNNHSKSTSLKALQFAMRSDTVMEMPLPFDQVMTRQQMDSVVYPYQRHDTLQTKRFAHISMEAIRFRIGLMETVKGDVLNFNDTKIGAKILEQRLGDDVCYGRDESGRRSPRQTWRDSVPIKDIVFPYIQFRDPELNRVLSYLRGKVLTTDEFSDKIKTKGVFTGLSANVGGVDFHFGTGGIHGAVSSGVYSSDADYKIRDIDVASLYPNVAIVNRIAPEHLGDRFVEEYSRLPKERKEWQAKKGKKCVEANSMKLASNGTYGNLNSTFSPFYDPRAAMSITINGQLLLSMLAEWLVSVPTLQILMINTDGITYRIHRTCEAQAIALEQHWERYTRLTLESVEYEKVWIRDVNSYVGRYVDGTLKQKGAYECPDAERYAESISAMQPPGWHKDWSMLVSVRAAVEHMTRGVDIERYVYDHDDPFDFMCRAKVDRSSRLMIGDREVQRICRYFVSTNGAPMRKVSPPAGPVGTWKRKAKVSDAEFYSVLREVGDAWDARIHTANRSKYETREMSLEAGYLVTECNRASDFDWESLNYQYYIDAAKKLVIG